ncbi:T9SS type A sorting domain-containing protein [Flavobacterium sedimenticola]|uniref:T9SS type A sorting domain-containing protein n=1 Tax=Flavobacterium sedimenticola TaxID=3043286 RepID=A0ABT6XQ18_9FLAO|nr:T9SS type A sorting domain-containing protein [Flavobacterium sedimenticola]MDI9257183.1 T9SS type A sorting domain-containing protein [Flavobacterium sedimenticola]
MKHLFFRSTAFLLWLAALINTDKNYGQTPTLQWAQSLESNHEHGIWSRATVTDSNGNFYVTGLYHGTVDFDAGASGTFPMVFQGGTVGSNGGEADVYVAKYNPQGALIWVHNLIEPTFANLNEERGAAMIIDGNQLYLTGFTSTRGFFVSKWNTDGSEIWTRYFDDVEENFVSTFALKKLNNSIIISGIFAGTMDFNPAAGETNNLTAFNSDGFLLSLTDSGNFEWVKQFRCNGGVLISGMETDSANNIFLSGIFLGTVDIDPNPGVNTFITSQSVSSGAISSAFIAKFNNSGDLIWNRHIRGTATTDMFMPFIKKDNQEDIILACAFKGNTTFLPTTTSLDTNGFYSSFLAKYNTNGTLMWTKHFGVPITNQSAFFPNSFVSNVIVDNCNNIYVSGEFQGDCDFNPAPEERVLSTMTNQIDAFIASYTTNGEHLWSMDIGKLGTVVFVDFNGYLPIALDHNNDIIITGTFRGQLDFDPSPTTEFLLNSNNIGLPNNAGIFMAKYDNPITCQLNNPDFEDVDFELYPNPSKGWVTIGVKELGTEATITVFDLSGKKVFSENIKQAESVLNLQNLAGGIYMVQLTSDNKTMCKKLILN